METNQIASGPLIARPPKRAGFFASIRKETDYEEAGGAPLLGVDGNVIISHGISSALAIRNAIRVAGELVTTRVNAQIVEAITPYLNHTVARTPPPPSDRKPSNE